MKIFVVIQGVSFETADIKGCFIENEAAHNYARELKTETDKECFMDNLQNNCDRFPYYHNGYDYITIEEHELK